jgi:hypothetical protein
MAEKSTVFSLAGRYETADEIESGKRFTLESGLDVLVARGGSPEFYKVAARAGKRFGKRGEIPPEKNLDSLLWTLARANFKAFWGPSGEKVIEAQVGKDVEQIEDTDAGRERLLWIYPDLRDEIMKYAGMTREEFQQEIEEAGKG